MTGLDDDWALIAELGSLSDEELRRFVRMLMKEEHEISYRRKLLHGRIAILRAELERRREWPRSS